MLFEEAHLLPFSKYESIGHDLPLFIKYTKTSSELWYYAAVHTFNPDDSQFDVIRKAFIDLNPELTLLEGSLKINADNLMRDEYLKNISNLSYDEVIKQKGEFGFALKLALESNSDVICPEPTDEDIIGHLSKEYTFTHIMLSYIIEMLVQNQTMNKGGILEQEVNSEFEWHKKRFGVFIDVTLENIFSSFRELTGYDLLTADLDLLNECNDPIPWSTKRYEWNILNTIAQSSTNYRDLSILRVIEHSFHKYQKILVVYGGSHYFAQKTVLDTLFSLNNK